MYIFINVLSIGAGMNIDQLQGNLFLCEEANNPNAS